MAINQRYTWGKWLTENKATCFPTFAKRRFLRPGETIEDFKEVSDAEKTALEKLRDGWTRPPQSFIDRWNRRVAISTCLGSRNGYNESTGYFELNTLTDLTYKDALAIFETDYVRPSERNVLIYGGGNNCRTNFCETKGFGIFPIFDRSYQSNRSIEVAVVYGVVSIECFENNVKLHTIRARSMDASSSVGSKVFASLPNRVDLNLGIFEYRANLVADLNLKGSPLISLKSVKGLIQGRSATNQIAITVHPDVYAKLTDRDDSEWYALLDLASEKNITFVTI